MITANSTFKDIVKAALRHYPASKNLRRQYVSKTSWLISTERHAVINGGWQPKKVPQCV